MYPLHVITMLMIVPYELVLMVFGDTGLSPFELIRNIVLNVFLVQSWYPRVGLNTSMNGVAWFLSCLVFCYFLYPMLVRKFRRKSFLQLSVLFVAILGIQFLISFLSVKMGHYDDGFYRWLCYDAPFFRVGDFACGIITAVVAERWIEKKELPWTVLEAVILVVCIYVQYWDLSSDHNSIVSRVANNWTTIYIPSACCLVVLFSFHKGILSNMAGKFKLLVYIGVQSPYFFLLHYVPVKYIVNMSLHFRIRVANWVLIILVLVFSLICTGLYKKVEYKVDLYEQRIVNGILSRL